MDVHQLGIYVKTQSRSIELEKNKKGGLFNLDERKELVSGGRRKL